MIPVPTTQGGFAKKPGTVIAGQEIGDIAVVDLLQELGVGESLQRDGVINIIGAA